MIYDFWKKYEKFLCFEQAQQFDYRLDNIEMKLNDFFQRLIVQHIEKPIITFYLAGSCIKADTFRDIDLFFTNREDRELINNALNKDFFEYENNSYTYTYKYDVYQLVYRERYEGATLKKLVSGFDFDSTKIAFECEYDTLKRVFKITQCDIRVEFVNYINTKVNQLSKVSANPFVSLQRAIYFLKRGDDVPYSVFLGICSKISDINIARNEKVETHFERLQGNPNKLENIKDAISEYIENEKAKREK